MSPAAVLAGGMPEFPILQTRCGLPCVLKPWDGRKLCQLTELLFISTCGNACRDGPPQPIRTIADQNGSLNFLCIKGIGA